MAARSVHKHSELAAEFRNGIRWAKSTTDPAQTLQIAEVVADIPNILKGNIPPFANSRRSGNLFCTPG